MERYINLINLIHRRKEYLIYAFFGFILLVCFLLAFWPKPAERFQTYIPSKDEVARQPGQSVSFQLVKAYGANELKRPVAVFVDEKNLYVSDAASNSVRVISRGDKNTAAITRTGKTRDSELNYPYGVAPFGVEKIIVAESGGKKLLIYKRDTTFLRQLQVAGGKIVKPGYILAQGNKVFIGDLAEHDIKVIDLNGKITAGIAKPLNGKQLLKYPQGMDVDTKGNLWVADGGNERIVCFDRNGHFLSGFNGSESGGSPFGMVKGLAIIHNNLLCVSDPIANLVRVFDISANLKEVASFGNEGKSEERFVYPMGLFVDQFNHLFVANRGNGRIQEFAVK